MFFMFATSSSEDPKSKTADRRPEDVDRIGYGLIVPGCYVVEEEQKK